MQDVNYCMSLQVNGTRNKEKIHKKTQKLKPRNKLGLSNKNFAKIEKLTFNAY